MGQHLGHLRALFRVMDNADAGVDLAPVSTSLARRDSLLNHLGYSPLAVTSSASHDYANVVVGQRSMHPAAPVHDYENVVLGTVDNAVQVDDIYEHIFGGGSEISAEENGNLVPAGVKASAMAARTECECDVHKASGGGARRSSRLSLVSSKRARAKLLRPVKETSGKKKRNNWVMKFNCARLKSGGGCAGAGSETDIPEPSLGCESCVCTGYRRTEEHHLGAGVVFQASDSVRRRDSRTSTESSSSEDLPSTPPEVLIDMSKFNPEDFPIEDCDERARLERAREIAEGVEPPPGFLPGQHVQLVVPPAMTLDNLTALFQSRLGVSPAAPPALSQLDVSLSPALSRGVHTQVDYIHCLVPDLLHITSCSFYWGKMDRYEAERLLEGRPEGTFLLRDSAQEEYLFSVSFRKYGRSLHARIEQWNHHFSFDSHDPGVFASPTVCGLIEHYKDPACCMFFEPMLTIPLHRNFPFPLQHLCRAVVSSRASYDGISRLQLPKPLKGYLKEYHYKQRVRVRVFESEQ